MIGHLKIDNFKSFNDCEVTFKTSLEVIQKVMNVPMCAVKSLLRSNGYNNINDETNLCIDEERLGIFSEAYIRKMKNYFTRSLQNIASLPPKERSDYNKFVELFKKQDLQKREPKKWETDIDIDHLKEAFIERIKEETKEQYASSSGMRFLISSTELFKNLVVKKEISCRLELLSDIYTTYSDLDSYKINLGDFINILKINKAQSIKISDYIYKFVSYSFGIGFIEQEDIEKKVEEEKENLKHIVYSEYYISEPVNDKPEWCGTKLITIFLVFARYHIYSMKDDEDSNNVNFNFMRA